VKVELNGSRVRCYLDGQLIHDVTVPAVQKFYAVSGRDRGTGDLIVKAINLSDAAVPAKLDIQGVDQVSSGAEATVLEAPDLADNNSLEQPTKVSPRTEAIDTAGLKFNHEFPPRSLTVLRLKARQSVTRR
jgi:alpha-L-arabinofuranosidase